MRVIAVDWSGAKLHPQKNIWLAEAAPEGTLLRLETDRDRDDIASHLIEEAGRGEPLAVGLDFAFSFPLWFMRERGFESAPALWAALSRAGEADRWLEACEPPLWGRGRRPRPSISEPFRRTEKRVAAVAGISCKSVFQVGGAGAVGTGSIRGMPVLHRLHATGFCIWPFTPRARATAVEIYPRLLAGRVNKSDAACRRAYLDCRFSQLTPALREIASSCEDAFDAAVSALVMARHADELGALEQAPDAQALLEGEIWQPAVPS